MVPTLPIAYWKNQWQHAKVFPHIVVDNFIPKQKAQILARLFPTSNDYGWHQFSNSREKKLAYEQIDNIHPSILDVIHMLNSPVFLKQLEEITGEKLYPDYGLMGGGLHMIEKGGKLDIHADFNFHPNLQKTRRLNLLLFLNENWKEEWGGQLELWQKDMSACFAKINPILGRMVLFQTDSISYHGHPHPLTCPSGTTRKSIALYYYTDGMPEQTHSTLFQNIPEGYTYDNVETI